MLPRQCKIFACFSVDKNPFEMQKKTTEKFHIFAIFIDFRRKQKIRDVTFFLHKSIPGRNILT